MDRRTWLAILLALGAYYVWMLWVSTNPVPEGTEPPPDVVGTEPADAPVVAEAPDEPAAPPVDREDIPLREIPVEACGFRAEWNTDGGYLQSLTLLDHKAPTETHTLWGWALSGFSGKWEPYGGESGPETLVTPDGAVLGVSTGDLSRRGPPVRVLEDSAGLTSMQGVTADNVEVTRQVRVHDEDPCVLQVDVSWRNLNPTPYSGGLWLGMHDLMSGEAGYYSNALRPYAMVDGDVETWGDLEDLTEAEAYPGPVQWFGIADRYFGALVLPEDPTSGTLFFSPKPIGGETGYGVHFVVDDALSPGETRTERFRVYVGPKSYDEMAAVSPSLASFVDWEYGFLAVVCYPLLWLLRFFHGIVGNWGLGIILLTVAVKGIFFPLTQMSFRSSAAMQAIQPRLQEIREQFGDNPEELNRRTIALFRENGVNPVGGCLPMLIQMPVWFALYRVLLSSVDLYHSDFLYLVDLSVPDPTGIMPVVVLLLMVVQQQLMPTGNMDPTQARILKLMPFFIGFIFFSLPAGLVLYIFVNTLLTILQQWLIKRQIKVPEPTAAPT